MLKKTLTALFAATFSFAAWADVPAPLLEIKFNEGDLAAVKTSNAAAVFKPGYPEQLAWGEGRLEGKAIEFKNDFPDKKRGGMGHFHLSLATLDINKPFSASVWVKLDPAVKNNGPQYTVFSTAKGDYGPGIRMYYSWGSFRVGMGDGTGKGAKSLAVNKAKQPFDAKAWNHLAFTYDGQKVCLYINGTLASSLDYKLIAGYKPIKIGCYSNGYAYGFRGWMQNMKFFNTALTAEQVLAESQAE